MYFISPLFKDIVTDSVVLDVLKVFVRFKWSKWCKLEMLRWLKIGENCNQIPKALGMPASLEFLVVYYCIFNFHNSVLKIILCVVFLLVF